MGRKKTDKKNQRSGPTTEDPDISETEPSSSDNVSNSLNETIVMNSGSSNIMDTDVEDGGQSTGNSTPAEDENPPGAGHADLFADDELPFGPVEGCDKHVSDDEEESNKNSSKSFSWFEVAEEVPKVSKPESESEVPPSVNCSHAKSSTSMAGLRKALKNEVNARCSATPCTFISVSQDSPDGEVERSSNQNNELWICLQCGHIGCGDHNAMKGDAENHFKTPRSDQHNIVLRFGEEMDKSWCYSCKSFVDTKHSSLKEAQTLLKRHPKVKQSLQSKAKTGTDAPIIALGPPPPPPQPEVPSTEITQFKSSLTKLNKMNKYKMNSRMNNKMYGSNWDNSNRDEWPLGLENLGNTCFMNSALQCLSRTKSLIPKLDLYGTGNTLEILVTADPPLVDVLGIIPADSNADGGGGSGDYASSLFQIGPSTSGPSMEENGDPTNGVLSTHGDGETGGSSPSSSEMDSLLDVASGGASSKSSPTKELAPENYKEEIEKELKKCLRLRLTIPKDSMTARLRHAFKAMTRSADIHQVESSYGGTSDYFGRVGRHVFTPSAIHSAMAKHFRPGQQHDSHELLRTVVDMMKKDQIKAFRLAIMQCYGIKKSEGKNCDPKIAELLKQWDRKLYHKTFVDEIFGGELVTFQTCLTCHSVRRSHEDFLDLSLPIRVYTKNQIPKRTYSLFDDDGDSNRSLEDCLKSFIEPEQLTGSNAVECENCHKRNLEKLANGASFEEVFPGVKPPVPAAPPEPVKMKPVLNDHRHHQQQQQQHPQPSVETEMDALEPLVMEEEVPQVFSSAEDMDDLDEPAVDGLIANTSDMEDEGNDVPPLYLPLENEQEKSVSLSTAEFINSNDLQNKGNNMSLSFLASTQDEGFSESDSSEEKKSASISASSSRNSISEADNNGAALTSSSSSSQQKGKEASKPIPITKCPCSRRQMVSRPPECLTIHLKRFQITSHGTSKLSDRVNFPYILNLTPFCARDDEDLQRLTGHDVFDEDGEVKYALYGIVEHSGSLHWGHYVAYIKVPGQQQQISCGSSCSNSGDGSPVQSIEGEASTSAAAPTTTDAPEGTNNCGSSSDSTNNGNSLPSEGGKPDKWFYISDSSVSPSSLESVLGMDPYILFYERIRGQEKKERMEQLHRLNNPSCSGSSSLAFESTAAAAAAATTTTATASATVTFNNDNSSTSTSVNYSLD